MSMLNGFTGASCPDFCKIFSLGHGNSTNQCATHLSPDSTSFLTTLSSCTTRSAGPFPYDPLATWLCGLPYYLPFTCGCCSALLIDFNPGCCFNEKRRSWISWCHPASFSSQPTVKKYLFVLLFSCELFLPVPYCKPNHLFPAVTCPHLLLTIIIMFFLRWFLFCTYC